MRRVLLALAVLLAASALSGGERASAAARPDYLSLFTAQAEAYWGSDGSQTCGLPTYSWVPEQELYRILRIGPDYPFEMPIAGATPSTCSIAFSKRPWGELNPGDMCVLVFHEIGHLFLREHTAGGLMAPVVPDWRDVPPCRRLLRTVNACVKLGFCFKVPRLRPEVLATLPRPVVRSGP